MFRPNLKNVNIITTRVTVFQGYLAILVRCERCSIITVWKSVCLCPPACVIPSLRGDPCYLGNITQVNLQELISGSILGNPSTIKTSWKTFICGFQSRWTRFYYKYLNIFLKRHGCAAQEKVVFLAVFNDDKSRSVTKKSWSNSYTFW